MEILKGTTEGGTTEDCARDAQCPRAAGMLCSYFQTAQLQTAPLQTAPLQTAPLQTAPIQTVPRSGSRSSLLGSVLLMILACGLHFLCICVPSVCIRANDAPLTIHVGFFQLDGYHEMEPSTGEKSGYGYDFLQLIAGYANFEYIYVGYEKSWQDMLDMLEDGRIDMLTNAEKTEELEERFDFTMRSIGASSAILTVSSSNETFIKNNFTVFDGMRIGLLRGGTRADSLSVYAAQNGFAYTVVYYDTLEQMQDALQDGGEIDAMVTDDLRHIAGEVVLDEFDSRDIYVMVRKGNTALRDLIDKAIHNLSVANPGWRSELSEQYSLEGYDSIISISPDEEDYLRQFSEEGTKLRVLFNPIRAPFCYLDENGEAKGALIDIFEKYASVYGIPYEYVKTTDSDDYLAKRQEGEADIVIDFTVSQDDAELIGYRLTSEYASANCSMVTKSTFKGDPDTVAIVRGLTTFETIAEAYIPDADVKYYADFDECFEAVKRGEAESALFYTITSQMLLVNDSDDALSSIQMEGVSVFFRIAVNGVENISLYSLMNKAAHDNDSAQTDSLLSIYLAQSQSEFSLKNYLRSHRLLWIMLLIVLLTASLVILLLRRRRILRQIAYERRANAMDKAISNTYVSVFHFNLVTGLGRDIRGETQSAESDQQEILAETFIKHFEEEELTSSGEEEGRNFWDFSTISERLAEKDIISHEVQTKDYGWIQISILAYHRDGDGHVTEVLWMTKDIDDEKKMQLEQQKALKSANNAALSASRAKTVFLSNMSHDIRTPMNAIVGFALIASAHPDDKERVNNCLKKILISGNHLQQLINDILDMSRIESGKVVIHETKCGLSELIHNLMPIIQPQVSAKHINFFVDTVGVRNEYIYADTLKLNQVLINLLGNAIKFTPANGTVSLRIEEDKCDKKKFGKYRFIVKDTGIGMSSEFLTRLFDPFEREESSAAGIIQGTGLGLSIAKKLVNMMGGTLSVRSELGKGTMFTVEVNLALQDIVKTFYRIEELSGYRTLIVDDDYEICSSVTVMLREIGLRPEWTTSAHEALLHAQSAQDEKDPFKAYIIDWVMPDMNGVELVRRLRAEIGRDIPIIILTAYDWSLIADEAKEAGVTAFCAKPVFMSDLKNALLSSVGLLEKKAPVLADKKVRGVRILVAEDNDLNREIAQEILEDIGFKVDTACDGSNAVDILRNSAPGTYRLVLMDIQMPVMNGYEAAKAIRQSERGDLARIPIVAMTANAFDEDRRKALESGMNGHLAKPLDVKKLMGMIIPYLES